MQRSAEYAASSCWLGGASAAVVPTTTLDYARWIEWCEEGLARLADIASGETVGWERYAGSWNDVRTLRRASLPRGVLLALLADLDRRVLAAIEALPEGAIESNAMLMLKA